MERPVKIKVCGLLHPGNIEEVCALEPDFAGYIFYPDSQRYVGENPDPAIFMIPGDGTARVGVFVNEEIPAIRNMFDRYLLDLVQLHGNESPGYCMQLVEAGIPVIKALNPHSAEMEGCAYGEVVHYLLYDNPGDGYGGSGQKFDWNLLNGIDIPLPFLVGGGIGPGDAELVRELGHPSLFGVDLNSRFETSPGVKDAGLLKQFIDEIRRTGK
jgi:phosphoribosylanthranilate isomerase